MKTNRRQFLRQSSLVAASAALAPFGSTVLPGLQAAANAGVPNDVRLQPLKDLNGYFPFTPPKSRQEWEARSETLKRRLLVALGLWPMPTRTALNPVIHGGIERENFRVEKVFFESVPGFFVTGNLYRPIQMSGKAPGILFAHGHFDDGRFMDLGEEAVRRQVASGAEHFEEGGRSMMQALCTGLARMGCVVFHYDMIGYADSQQLSLALVHKFAKQRPETISPTPGRWGLFSPQAESHLAKRDGTANLELDAVSRFFAWPSRSGPRARRLHRRQRGGNSDLYSQRLGSSRESRLPGGHGQHRHAGRLHL